MSPVQTVYIQYTQLKRAVNPPRKKMAAGEADAPGGAAKKRTAFAARALAGLPRRPVCLFWSAARARSRAPPPGMFASALPPARSWVRPVRSCSSRSSRTAARALAGSPRCPVCLFWSAARARSRAPPPGMFASALPPALAGLPCRRVCLFWSAARARSRAPPPGMFASACRPRLRVRRAVPPGMTVSAPPQCAYSRAARVCLRAAMGANQRAAPPGMLISAPPRRRAARESTPARGR